MSQNLILSDPGRSLGTTICLLSTLKHLGIPTEINFYKQPGYDLTSELIKVFGLNNINVTYNFMEHIEENPFFVDTNKFFAPYLNIDTLYLNGVPSPVNVSNKKMIAIACYGDNDPNLIIYEDKVNCNFPKNKQYSIYVYQHIFKLCREAGYDVITIDSKTLPLEQKIKLLNEHVDCIIGYEGGLSHLAHVLKIPNIILPWHSAMDDDFKEPKDYFDFAWLNRRDVYCHSLHLDKRTYICDSINEVMNWNGNNLNTIISNLKELKGNNYFLNGKEFKYYLTSDFKKYRIDTKDKKGEYRDIIEISNNKLISKLFELKGDIKINGEIPINIAEPTLGIINKNKFFTVISDIFPDSRDKVQLIEFVDIENYLHHTLLDFSKKSYFYVEFLHSTAFKYCFEELVPKDILSEIIHGDITLILSNAHEAYHAVVENIYTDVIQYYNIPAEKILLLTLSPDIKKEIEFCSKKYKTGEIQAAWINEYEYASHNAAYSMRDMPAINNAFGVNTLENKMYIKKFVSFNGISRAHRGLVVSYLKAKDYIKYGYMSYNSLGDKPEHRYHTGDVFFYNLKNYVLKHSEWNKFLDENAKSIKELKPIYLDTNEFNQRNMGSLTSANKAFYENTYFSIVSETLAMKKHSMDGNTGIGRVLSEKTFKAIINRHPFIIVGAPKTLQLLKEFGYRTFDPFINESYDEIDNDAERLWRIVTEIDKLINLSQNELTAFLNFCKPIVEHNYNNLCNRKGPWGIYL